MKKIILASIILSFLFTSFIFVIGVNAEANLGYELEVPLPPGVTTVTGLPQYIGVVYNFSIGLLAILALLMVVMGGFSWITAAGNETKITAAKTTLVQAIIGLVIGLGSFVLLNTINPNLVTFSFSIPTIETSYSGSSSSSGSGGGSCTVPDSGNCAPDFLAAHGAGDYFTGDDLNKAAAICQGESGGRLDAASGTDKCKDGTSFSHGLFQINLMAHGDKIIGADCTNMFTIDATGAEPDDTLASSLGKCIGEWNDMGDGRRWCSERDCVAGANYQTCVDLLANPDLSIDIAGQIYPSQGWNAWGANSNCRY